MLSLEELKSWASTTGFSTTLQRFRSDWRRLPTLTQGLREVLVEAGISSPTRESLAA